MKKANGALQTGFVHDCVPNSLVAADPNRTAQHSTAQTRASPLSTIKMKMFGWRGAVRTCVCA
jgi:hypothetical protein